MAFSAHAQNAQRNWFFGNQPRGIAFNRPNYNAVLVSKPAVLYGLGGGSVATDPVTGNLLFYTDGKNVYDVNHSAMSTGLNGDNDRNQAAAICKAPGASNTYYIFTNSATGTIEYSIVDMSLGLNAPAPPTGQVMLINQNIPTLPTGLSEAMIIIPHKNGEDFWLVNHESASNTFWVTPITATGIGVPTSFPLGSIGNAANFAYNPTLDLISVSPKEAGRNIEFITFDDAGITASTLNKTIPLNLSAAASLDIYDTEWSKDNRYLYVSVSGQTPTVNPDLLQYDLTDPTLLPTSILTNSITSSYGLQMAPDSTIYHIYESAPGTFLVGRILDTDSIASKVRYRRQAFTNGAASINFNSHQFPSFAPKDTIKITVDFVPPVACANSPASFLPTVELGADSLVWDFADGSFGTGWNPVHTYTTAGTFNAKVTAYLNGDSASVSHDVTVKQFDLQINLVSDTTACSAELPFPKDRNIPGCTSGCFTLTAQVTGTPVTTEWYGPAGQLGNQTTTLSPDSIGVYYLIVGDGAGCEAYASVNIKEYGIQDMRANIWHFGEGAGIDFNPLFRTPPSNGPAVAIAGPLNTEEGSAVIGDNNGQIIFSTDGQSIFDRTKTDITPAPNPPGLGGREESTQSSVIIPVPGDETLFYIFSTQPTDVASSFNLSYSLFDLKKGTNGQVVEFNQLLFSNSTERITSNGSWLIAHEYGNNAFRAYPITATGIGNPVITNIGSDHSFSITGSEGQGYMELGNQNILAVALSNPGTSNVVELFDFDSATGILTNYRVADTNIATGQIYGIEFSGNKLLTTISGAPNSSLVEFAIDTLLMPILPPLVTPVAGKLGAIQSGPDGQIYVAVDGSDFLATVTLNPSPTLASTITLNGFNLNTTASPGAHSNLGLPNFISFANNSFNGPSLSFSGVCFGDSTVFTGSGTDVIDNLSYSFGDGTVVSGINLTQVSHVYSAPGTYNVILTISNRCGFLMSLPPQVVQIFAYPPDPTATVPLCAYSVQLNANPTATSGLTYLWPTTGDTTKILSVNQLGTYAVAVTGPGGCTTNGNINVISPLPRPIDLGPDSLVCSQAGASKILNTNLNFNTHSWTLNGSAVGGTGSTQPADFSVPGTFKYKVVFTLPTNSACKVSDSVTYLVQQSPVFTALPTDPTNCTSNDGTINLTVTAPSPATDILTYTVTPPGGASASVPFNTPTLITGLSGGAYTVTVRDEITTCSTPVVTSLNGTSAFTVNPTRNGFCDPSLKINIITTPAIATPIDYRIVDVSTGLVADAGTLLSSGLPNNIALPSGTSYIVEVTTGSCTNPSLPFLLNPDPTITVSFDLSDICNGNLTAVTSPAATSFDWSLSEAGSLTDLLVNAPTVTVNSNPVGWNMVLTASNGGADCPGTLTQRVTVDNITPNITASTCVNPVVLTATPSGSYFYDWYKVATPTNTQLPPSNNMIDVSQYGSGSYYVEVTSTITACPAVASSPLPVDIIAQGVLSGTIDLPLCSGTPFTLTANPNRQVTSYEWSFNGNTLPNSNVDTWTDTKQGDYEVEVSDGTCTATFSRNVSLPTLIPINMPVRAFLCPDQEPPASVALTPGSNFSDYQWFLDNVEQTAFAGQPTFLATSLGTYSVMLIDNSTDCPRTAATEIRKQCTPVLNAPTAFRPITGKAANIEFNVFSLHVSEEDFQIFIFNRWGEMVYQSADLNFRWNGTFNNSGTTLPAGTYTWVAKFKGENSENSKIQEKRGGVVLLR